MPNNKNKKQKVNHDRNIRVVQGNQETFEDLTDHFLQHPTFKNKFSREQIFNILKFPDGLMTVYLIVSAAKNLFNSFTVDQLSTMAGCAQGFRNIYAQLDQHDVRASGLLLDNAVDPTLSSVSSSTVNEISDGSCQKIPQENDSPTKTTKKRSFSSLSADSSDTQSIAPSAAVMSSAPSCQVLPSAVLDSTNENWLSEVLPSLIIYPLK